MKLTIIAKTIILSSALLGLQAFGMQRAGVNMEVSNQSEGEVFLFNNDNPNNPAMIMRDVLPYEDGSLKLYPGLNQAIVTKAGSHLIMLSSSGIPLVFKKHLEKGRDGWEYSSTTDTNIQAGKSYVAIVNPDGTVRVVPKQ